MDDGAQRNYVRDCDAVLSHDPLISGNHRLAVNRCRDPEAGKLLVICDQTLINRLAVRFPDGDGDGMVGIAFGICRVMQELCFGNAFRDYLCHFELTLG